jgi:hypothetical protein
MVKAPGRRVKILSETHRQILKSHGSNALFSERRSDPTVKVVSGVTQGNLNAYLVAGTCL